jgi:hypothetical protein
VQVSTDFTQSANSRIGAAQEQAKRNFERAGSMFTTDNLELNDEDVAGSELVNADGVRQTNRASNLTQKADAESMFSDLSSHRRHLRNQRKALAGTMRLVQKSLDSTAPRNRHRARHHNRLFQSQAFDSMYSRDSPWIDDVKQQKGLPSQAKADFLSKAVPGLEKSKNYYMKYIHEDNKARIRASNEAVMNFIPQSKTEKKTYNQRFKHYMNQLEQEQRAEEDAQMKE